MSKDRHDVLGDDAKAPPVSEGRSQFGLVRLWVGIAAGCLLVLFLFQNLQKAEVNFLWMSYDIRTIYALLIAAALGALTALSIGYLRGRARSRSRRGSETQPKK